MNNCKIYQYKVEFADRVPREQKCILSRALAWILYKCVIGDLQFEIMDKTVITQYGALTFVEDWEFREDPEDNSLYFTTDNDSLDIGQLIEDLGISMNHLEYSEVDKIS